MLRWVFITVTLLAFTTSVLTFGFGLYFSLNREGETLVETVGGIAGGLLWFVAAFGATSITVVESGITTVEPAPTLTYLFGALGILSIVIGFIGTARMLDVRDATQGEMGL